MEGGLGPSQEVQEPLGEGFPSSVFLPVSRGVVQGEGLKGVGVGLGSSSPHGPFGHGGVGWAFPDEVRDRPVPQVGDVEGGESAVVGEEPVGPGGSSRGDRGWGGSSPQEGDVCHGRDPSLRWNTRTCSARRMTRLSITRVAGVSVPIVLARLFWTGSGDVAVCIMTSVAILLYD